MTESLRHQVFQELSAQRDELRRREAAGDSQPACRVRRSGPAGRAERRARAMEDELVARHAHPQDRGGVLVAMAVDFREQERDLVHEAKLPRPLVEKAADPVAGLADGNGKIGSRSQDRFGIRQRVAQLDRGVAIRGAKVIDDEMARDAAQPGIDVRDRGPAVIGARKKQRLLRDVRGVGGIRDEAQDERVEPLDRVRRELARGRPPRNRANRSVRAATARRRSRGRLSRDRQHSRIAGRQAPPFRRDKDAAEVGTNVARQQSNITPL